MRRTIFANNSFYHIFNRGVEKRKIFLEERDYLRFYVSLFAFNDPNYKALEGLDVRDILNSAQGLDLGDRFVNVVSFCLMPNHFHCLLEQVSDGGIKQFMHRVGTGYVMYFNKKYERTGRLFEGPFKAVLVKREGQFEHLPRYIHLNALDLTDLNWRDGEITDWETAERFLERYPWSSHHVYLGQPQRLPVVEQSVFHDMWNTPEKYLTFLRSWSARDLAKIQLDKPKAKPLPSKA